MQASDRDRGRWYGMVEVGTVVFRVFNNYPKTMPRSCTNNRDDRESPFVCAVSTIASKAAQHSRARKSYAIFIK